MPPTPIAVGDIAQAVIRLRYASQTYLNVLHYKSATAYPAQTYESIMDQLAGDIHEDLASGIINPYRAALPDTVEVVDITTQRVYPTRDFYVRVAVGQVGTYDGPTNSGNIGATITKRSERAGRGRSGSFHTPALPLTGSDGGLLTEDYTALLEVVAERLRSSQLGDVAGEGFFPGMYNGSLGTPLNWSEIIGTTVQPTARVMRRRTVGVGI